MQKKLGVVIIIGVIVGVLTLFFQSILPTQFNFLANSGAIWLIPAYFVTKNQKVSQSIIYSLIELETCVISYYIFEAIYNSHMFTFNRMVLVWLMCGAFASILFGLTNKFSKSDNLIGSICFNILPAIFISEAISHIIHISQYSHMIWAIVTKLLIGVVLYFAINKKKFFRFVNLLGLFIVSILGLLFYEMLCFILS